MMIAQSTHTDVVCAFSIKSPWIAEFSDCLSNIKWINSWVDFLSYMWLERREKRKPHTSKKCYIPSMGFIRHWIWRRFTMLLWVIESEVNSPCFWVLPEVQNRSSIPEGSWVFRENSRYQFGPVSIHSYTQWHQSSFSPCVVSPRFKWLVSFFCFTTLFVHCLSILLPLTPILKPNIISNQSFQPMRLVDFNSNTITYVKTLHS